MTLEQLHQLTPKQMYYAIQEDRMSLADFEAWQEAREEREYNLGWVSGDTYASHLNDE